MTKDFDLIWGLLKDEVVSTDVLCTFYTVKNTYHYTYMYSVSQYKVRSHYVCSTFTLHTCPLAISYCTTAGADASVKAQRHEASYILALCS